MRSVKQRSGFIVCIVRCSFELVSSPRGSSSVRGRSAIRELTHTADLSGRALSQTRNGCLSHFLLLLDCGRLASVAEISDLLAVVDQDADERGWLVVVEEDGIVSLFLLYDCCGTSCQRGLPLSLPGHQIRLAVLTVGGQLSVSAVCQDKFPGHEVVMVVLVIGISLDIRGDTSA